MTILLSFSVQLALVAALLLVIFAGPAAATWALVRRKRLAREVRHSPIGIELLRAPGHALREKIEEIRLDVMGDIMGLCLIPSLILAVHLAQSYVLHAPESAVRLGFGLLLALGCLAGIVRRLFKHSVELDTLRLGLDAEVAVGQQLDRLMRQGAIVFHDFPADKFNIDHVVIASQGVFAVETKGFSKRRDLRGKERARVSFDGHNLHFPGWTTSEPVEQAERQAKWLTTWLSKAAAIDVIVQPVVALPGRFLERTGQGAVTVYSGAQLEWLLDRKDGARLSPKAMEALAHQIEQRCRDVVPSYRA